MNNKGFTLIELIATIALLGIIAIISFVSISGVIKKSKVNDCENLVMNVKSAVKEYVSDNRYNFTSNNTFIITGDVLINNKYLRGPIVNPFSNSEFNPGDIRMSVELNDDYTVKNITIEAPSILSDCESGI